MIKEDLIEVRHDDGASFALVPARDGEVSFADLAGPAERLQEVLERFRSRVDGVRAIAVADKNGLPVAASFRTRVNVLTITAMATLAIQSSLRVYENLGLAGPNEVVMAGADTSVLVSSMSLGQLTVIVVLEGFANLALVRIEVDRLAREVSEILQV
jgi:predicted regulator of Ras-like GTPase activity (Roadblock/LC7/MglB family)